MNNTQELLDGAKIGAAPKATGTRTKPIHGHQTHGHTTLKRAVLTLGSRAIDKRTDEQPAEIFLRVKGRDCSSELIGLYDVMALLMGLLLRCTASA